MADDTTEDEKAFGTDAWVYCRQHLRPHRTGWCTVHLIDKRLLEASTLEEAVAECEAQGLKLMAGG
jgi:hypothetical protein